MDTRFPRNLLAGAILLAPSAGAVTLSTSGVGQVLVYPYYTVNKGQDTLISITNATAVGKVLAVRFLEGYNGRYVLDFRLFLSPHDVWTAAISQTADDGGARLKTSDRSCTLPALAADGEPFVSTNYDGSGSVPGDQGPTGITRTREGFIEIFAVGDIVLGSATDTAVTHVQAALPGQGTPPGCASLTIPDVANDVVAPTGGVFGTGSVVNVGQGTFFAYNAEALQGFTDIPLMSAPGDLAPSFGDANNADAVAGVATAHVFNESGRQISLDYAAGADAVSAIFMADTVYNEYLTAATLGANTDWVVTMPTKEFYVDKVLYPANPTTPFVEAFHAPGQSATSVATTIADREEGTIQQPCQPGWEPPPCEPPISLLYEVNVLPFNTGQALTPWPIGAPSGVLGSKLTPFAIDAYGDDGNAILDVAGGDGIHQLPGGTDADGQAMTLNGLPVTGFMVYNIINAHAQPGLLANYGGTFAHRTTMSCVGVSALCAQVITRGGAQDVR